MLFTKLIQFNENIQKYTIDLTLYVKSKCQKINFRVFVISFNLCNNFNEILKNIQYIFKEVLSNFQQNFRINFNLI